MKEFVVVFFVCVCCIYQFHPPPRNSIFSLISIFQWGRSNLRLYRKCSSVQSLCVPLCLCVCDFPYFFLSLNFVLHYFINAAMHQYTI